MSKSIGIIGAGIGGLTAAAYLALDGHNVTILEKASTVGGSAGWYIRNGRMFPTGATIAFGFEEGGLLRSMLNELQIELPTTLLNYPMDVILPDRKIAILKDPIQWQEELERVFPERSKDVGLFWNELMQISDGVYHVTMCRTALPIRRWYDLGMLPQYACRHPRSMLRLARYARWNVQDLMIKYRLETYLPLRHFLDAQLLDAVQTDVTQAALLPSSLALNIYRRGSYHLKKGMGQLSKALADRVEALGGQMILNAPVRDIHFDKIKRQWEVQSKKHSAVFQRIINNTGISFGQGTSYADQNLFSWGAFRIDAIVEDVVWVDGLGARQLPFSYQIVPHAQSVQLFRDAHGPIYVTFNHTLNKNGQLVEGEVTMTFSIHTDLRKWASFSKEEYNKKKDQLTEAIFLEVEQVIPFRTHIIYAQAGTPLTYQKFIGKGEVGGFPLTVSHAILKPKGVRSTLPLLYIAGEQTFPGPGTMSSMLSGYFSARAIREDGE